MFPFLRHSVLFAVPKAEIFTFVKYFSSYNAVPLFIASMIPRSSFFTASSLSYQPELPYERRKIPRGRFPQEYMRVHFSPEMQFYIYTIFPCV